MKIYYHDDPDGRCSAFLVRHFRVPELDPESTITFVPMQYDKKINFDSIASKEEVWIVDFSFEIVDFEKILEKTNNIYWIDHHKSSIEKYADFLRNHPLMGVRIPEGSAGRGKAYR
jgi:oligoribonuclease NrnB/cAMP/cGMP phosphodiesterase (DHH superfamily)